MLAGWAGANPAEFVGTLTGVAGALMLATRCRWAAWAWPVWMVSNGAWAYYACLLPKPAYGLVVQQIVFGIVNVLGAWNWLRASKERSCAAADFDR